MSAWTDAGLYQVGDKVVCRVRLPWRPWRWGKRRNATHVYQCFQTEPPS